jgi:hypothetical protein
MNLVISRDGKICSTVHYKPTDSHSYLQYSSFHPKKVKDSIPFAQMLRLRRLVSQNDDFEEKKEEMGDFFQQRGYPMAIINEAKDKTTTFMQEQLLQPKQPTSANTKLPFVTNYHPAMKRVFAILRNNWQMLQQESHSAVFKEGPLLSMRKGKSVCDMLLHSKLKSSEEAEGTLPCGRPRCLTCQFTSDQTNYQGPDGCWSVQGSHTCTTENVVYVIKCSRCEKMYVGETKRKLGDRFREHRRDILNKSDVSPVAQHFCVPPHTIHGGLILREKKEKNGLK